MEEKQERRFKNLELADEAMIHLFRDGQLITNGLPEGSRIVNFTHDQTRNTYIFTVQNDAFEPVETGDEIPTIQIEALNTALENTTKLGLETSNSKMY